MMQHTDTPPAAVIPAQTPQTQGWRARLALGFRCEQGRTVLARREHFGPLVVQKPFYPEQGGVCHVYVVHPPGGVVGGDALELDLELGEGAHALLTTPAAGKFYRSAGPTATQRQHFHVAKDALLEWLPQEQILYPEAEAKLATCVELEPGARFCGFEIACLGLPASSSPFKAGRFRQHFCISRQGHPLFEDRSLFDGQSESLSSRIGLGGATVAGLLVATLPDDAALAAVRCLLSELSRSRAQLGASVGLTAATRMGELVVVRYLGDDAWEAKEAFAAVWTSFRLACCGAAPVPPRIWQT